jgi:hypothetical protein
MKSWLHDAISLTVIGYIVAVTCEIVFYFNTIVSGDITLFQLVFIPLCCVLPLAVFYYPASHFIEGFLTKQLGLKSILLARAIGVLPFIIGFRIYFYSFRGI